MIPSAAPSTSNYARDTIERGGERVLVLVSNRRFHDNFTTTNLFPVQPRHCLLVS
jgi:hypothetical protein